MTNNSGVKVLAGNAAALVALQVTNYISPLLLIPYLTRTLGIELYGVIAFGIAVVQIACIVTDYGFNLSATFHIASARGDGARIRGIVGEVMVCKLGLLSLTVFTLCVFIMVDHKYDKYEIYFWSLIIALVGQTFQPIFLFQGIEKMFLVTLYTGAARLTHLAGVFILVADAQDYWLVGVSYGISQILATALGVAIMINIGYRPNWPKWDSVWATFSHSTPFFWGRAAGASYAAGGTIFLGFFSTPVQAALYSSAEQLFRGAVLLMAPLHQALYPYMTRTRDIKLFGRIIIFAIAIAFLGLAIGMAIGPSIIHFIFGEEFEAAYPVLVVFMVIFLIVVPSGLLGYPFLAALGNSAAANKSIVYGSLVQLLLLPACYYFGWLDAVHAVLTILAVELTILVYRSIAAIGMLKKLGGTRKADSLLL